MWQTSAWMVYSNEIMLSFQHGTYIAQGCGEMVPSWFGGCSLRGLLVLLLLLINVWQSIMVSLVLLLWCLAFAKTWYSSYFPRVTSLNKASNLYMIMLLNHFACLFLFLWRLHSCASFIISFTGYRWFCDLLWDQSTSVQMAIEMERKDSTSRVDCELRVICILIWNQGISCMQFHAITSNDTNTWFGTIITIWWEI